MTDKHEFVILIDGVLQTFDRYEDIPDKFDNIIKFKPSFKDGPHTHDEHDEIMQWNEKLQRLMEKERARSSKNR